MTSIFLSDDHPLICEGIKAILHGNQEYVVVGQETNPELIVQRILVHQPEILFLDIDMGRLSGFDVISQIKDNNIDIKVVIMSMHSDEFTVLKALDMGVKGYLTKDLLNEEILSCLQSISRNERYICEGVFKQNDRSSVYLDNVVQFRQKLGNLTKTEKNIIRLINEGYNTKLISERLFVSHKTVENHRYNICRKLDISGQNSLLTWVGNNKLLIYNLS